MAKGLHKKALTQILQIMHTRTYQFPESKIQKFKKFNAEFRIEKKKHLLIDWAFFTDIEIICQIEASPRFLPYQTATGSWPGNHIIEPLN